VVPRRAGAKRQVVASRHFDAASDRITRRCRLTPLQYLLLLALAADQSATARRAGCWIRDRRSWVTSGENNDGGEAMLLWLLVLLLLLAAVGGGVFVSNFLFILLVVAIVLALFGAFNRSAV
jgi:hypothetical protein